MVKPSVGSSGWWPGDNSGGINPPAVTAGATIVADSTLGVSGAAGRRTGSCWSSVDEGDLRAAAAAAAAAAAMTADGDANCKER